MTSSSLSHLVTQGLFQNDIWKSIFSNMFSFKRIVFFFLFLALTTKMKATERQT